MTTPYEPDLSFLDNYDDEDQGTPLVKQLRKEVDRLAKASKKAHEEGQKAARQEFEQRQAREKALADVPPALHALFGDVDPTDSAAKNAKLEQLKTAGITWGQSESPPPEQPGTPPAPLDRMAQVSAGGSIPNSDDDRALKIKERVDRGEGFGTPEDQQFYLDYYARSAEALTQARSRGFG